MAGAFSHFGGSLIEIDYYIAAVLNSAVHSRAPLVPKILLSFQSFEHRVTISQLCGSLKSTSNKCMSNLYVRLGNKCVCAYENHLALQKLPKWSCERY